MTAKADILVQIAMGLDKIKFQRVEIFTRVNVSQYIQGCTATTGAVEL